ncbi:MAG: FISUMP domain-containing protein, partial [Bacteroidales bacterium]|nr:FISUMP domain-containing protein [Bacteroidales bacterium]
GEMILGEEEMTDNGVMEKYCYNNEPDSCSKYGGLYQWWEMMQYTTQQGVQGICPLGWHLPTDEEWKVLEGAVDSQYGIGDTTWDDDGPFRGYDAGMNLKTTRGWIENGNGTDLFGFSGLPGGHRNDDGYFGNVTIGDYRWTSTEDDNYVAWCRILGYSGPESVRVNLGKNYGFSVRCLRDP